MKRIAIRLIEIYQFFSRLTPPVCRFTPTCSEYARQAIEKYGFLKGFKLGFLRLMRCHPWSEGGHDPLK